MHTVTLLGDIGDKFGETWTMNVEYVKDIFKLIECQRPGFKQYLIDCHEKGVTFDIQRGDEYLETEEELFLSEAKDDFIITAGPAGSKSGIGKFYAAGVLIVVSVFFPPLAGAAQGSFLAKMATGMQMMAVSLILQGVAQLLMPGPETDTGIDPNTYLFSGAQTALKEGVPVPVLYGELIVGGAVINQSFTTMDMTTADMKLAPNPRENSGDWDDDRSHEDGV